MSTMINNYLPYIASSVELEGKAVGFVSSRNYKHILSEDERQNATIDGDSE